MTVLPTGGSDNMTTFDLDYLPTALGDAEPVRRVSRRGVEQYVVVLMGCISMTLPHSYPSGVAASKQTTSRQAKQAGVLLLVS